MAEVTSGYKDVIATRATNGEVADTLRFSWSQTKQDIAGNYTDISWQLLLISARYGSISSNAPKNYVVTVDGEKKTGSNTVGIGASTQKPLASGTKRIYHDNGGKKKLSVSFSQAFNISFNGSVGTISGSASWDLKTIPRATKPVLDKTVVTMGENIMISLAPAVNTWTHTLYHDFCAGEWTQFASGAGTSATLTTQTSWAGRIPDLPTGTGKIRCVTYNGTTVVGEQIVSFRAEVPESVVPVISSIAITEAVEGIKTQFSAYIQGHSKLNVKVNAEGAQGSTVKSGKISVGSNSYEGIVITTKEIQQSGSVKVTAIVTDSRGRTATKEATVTVLPYTQPTIVSFRAYRATLAGAESNEGTTLKVEYNFSISNCLDKNTKNFKIEYRKSTVQTWTALTSGSVYSANTSALKTGALTQEDVYIVRLTLTDFFNTLTPVQYEWKVEATIFPLAYLPNLKGVGIGGLPTKEAFQVFMQSEFFKTLRIMDADGDGMNLDVAEELLRLIAQEHEYIELRRSTSVSVSANGRIPFDSVDNHSGCFEWKSDNTLAIGDGVTRIRATFVCGGNSADPANKRIWANIQQDRGGAGIRWTDAIAYGEYCSPNASMIAEVEKGDTLKLYVSGATNAGAAGVDCYAYVEKLA